jgi:hypothetical protein
MTIGTPNSYGTLITPNAFKSGIFISGILNWDYRNAWRIDNQNYPKLGGTETQTYEVVNEIRTIEDLYMMRKNLSGSYTLMNDLDFNSVSSYRHSINKTIFTSGEGWLPLGNSSTSMFTGNFNGNNHIIKNLYVNRPEEDYAGLFGYLSGSAAKVEKLGVENVNIIGKMYVGGVIGRAVSSTITNVYSTGEVEGKNNYTGGLIGEADAVISNTYSMANVKSTSVAGGLVGNNYSSILNSFAGGNVTVTGNKAGGLIGYASGGSYTTSYRSNTAIITLSGSANTEGNAAIPTDLQALSLTGLTTWDKTNIWKINSGAYPTFK